MLVLYLPGKTMVPMKKSHTALQALQIAQKRMKRLGEGGNPGVSPMSLKQQCGGPQTTAE